MPLFIPFSIPCSKVGVNKTLSVSPEDINHSPQTEAYGEIKTAERYQDTYELVRDLVRCSIFSKEAIDIHHMSSNLFFQVVGSRISFHLFSLKADGVYILVEICALEIPMSIDQLPQLMVHLDEIMLVLRCFRVCKKMESSDASVESMRRQTLDSPSFRAYIGKKKCRFSPRTLLF